VGFGGASLATSRLSNIGKVLGKAGVTLGVQGVNIAARYLEETNKQTGSSKTYKQGGQIQLNQGGGKCRFNRYLDIFKYIYKDKRECANRVEV
jgi:hypothetical protein